MRSTAVNELHDLMLSILDPLYWSSDPGEPADPIRWSFREICETSFSDHLASELAVIMNQIIEE